MERFQLRALHAEYERDALSEEVARLARDREQLAQERDALKAELRLKEASQVPVMPKAAADHLDAMVKRAADLEVENDNLKTAIQNYRDRFDQDGVEIDALKVENERLRTELEARPKVYFPVEETAREVDNLLKAIDVAEKNTEDRQAEVERLQDVRKQYEREVKRLRADLGDLHRMGAGADERVNELKFKRDAQAQEIERLREEQDAAIAVASEWKMQLKEVEAERDALKAALDGDDLVRRYNALLKERGALKAAVEQHRESAMEMSRVATTREGRQAYEWAAAHIELLGDRALAKLEE